MGQLRGNRGYYAGYRPVFAGSSRLPNHDNETGGTWSLLWVSLSLLFAAGFWWYLDGNVGREVANTQTLAFLTGYVMEKALAVDNVFVWLMLFSYFAVPAAIQRRVLIYGILGAIVLRTA